MRATGCYNLKSPQNLLSTIYDVYVCTNDSSSANSLHNIVKYTLVYIDIDKNVFDLNGVREMYAYVFFSLLFFLLLNKRDYEILSLVVRFVVFFSLKDRNEYGIN